MKYAIILGLALAGSGVSANAADFFSTEQPEKLFNVNVRVGVNTSNRNVNKEVFDVWNRNAWGTGFNLGATVDINFRDWISIQPGIFFDSRSGSWAYASNYSDGNIEEIYTQFGKGRSYNLNIPVLASVHFNITDNVRWNVEAGPYIQLKLKSEFNDSFGFPIMPFDSESAYRTGKSKAFDFGFKFGSSLDILRHYNVGIHYLAGCIDAWKPSMLGGRNKEWVFTVGYNF